VREQLQRFEAPDETESEPRNLSLYSLYPRSRVKIYDVEEDIALRAMSVDIGAGTEVRDRSVNDTGSAAVLVARTRERPKWSPAGTALTPPTTSSSSSTTRPPSCSSSTRREEDLPA
jgi:hypothetical protein